MNWREHRKKLLKDPQLRKALKETELEFQIAKGLIEARIKRGLTQKELAQKMRTKQSVISRAENAKTTPSLSFLKRLAKVLNTSLQVQLKP